MRHTVFVLFSKGKKMNLKKLKLICVESSFYLFFFFERNIRKVIPKWS